MKNYELTYLILSSLNESELEELQNKIISLITNEGGVFLSKIPVLKKTLAYSVEKQPQAYLASLNFQLSAEKIALLEKQLKEESQILRYLVLNKKPIKEKKVARSLSKPKVIEKIERIKKEKKVELKEFEKKLEEILDEDKE